MLRQASSCAHTPAGAFLCLSHQVYFVNGIESARYHHAVRHILVRAGLQRWLAGAAAAAAVAAATEVAAAELRHHPCSRLLSPTPGQQQQQALV